MKLEFVKLQGKRLDEQNVQPRSNVGSSAPKDPVQSALAGRGTAMTPGYVSMQDRFNQMLAQRHAEGQNLDIKPTSSPNATAPAQPATMSNRRDVQNKYGSGGRNKPNVAPNPQAAAPDLTQAGPLKTTNSAPNTQAAAPTPRNTNRTVNTFKNAQYSQGGEFDVPGVTRATIDRAAQRFKDKQDTQEVITTSLKRQETARRQLDIMKRSRGSVNPALQATNARTYTSADGNYSIRDAVMKNTNPAAGRLAGPDQITSGGRVVTDRLATGAVKNAGEVDFSGVPFIGKMLGKQDLLNPLNVGLSAVPGGAVAGAPARAAAAGTASKVASPLMSTLNTIHKGGLNYVGKGAAALAAKFGLGKTAQGVAKVGGDVAAASAIVSLPAAYGADQSIRGAKNQAQSTLSSLGLPDDIVNRMSPTYGQAARGIFNNINPYSGIEGANLNAQNVTGALRSKEFRQALPTAIGQGAAGSIAGVGVGAVNASSIYAPQEAGAGSAVQGAAKGARDYVAGQATDLARATGEQIRKIPGAEEAFARETSPQDAMRMANLTRNMSLDLLNTMTPEQRSVLPFGGNITDEEWTRWLEGAASSGTLNLGDLAKAALPTGPNIGKLRNHLGQVGRETLEKSGQATRDLSGAAQSQGSDVVNQASKMFQRFSKK